MLIMFFSAKPFELLPVGGISNKNPTHRLQNQLVNG